MQSKEEKKGNEDVGPGGTIRMPNLMMIDRPKMLVPGQKEEQNFVIFSFWALPGHVVADPKAWHMYYFPVEENTQEIREATYIRIKGRKRLPLLVDTYTAECLHKCEMAFEIEGKGLGIAAITVTVPDIEAFKAKCLAVEKRLPKDAPSS